MPDGDLGLLGNGLDGRRQGVGQRTQQLHALNFATFEPHAFVLLRLLARRWILRSLLLRAGLRGGHDLDGPQHARQRQLAELLSGAQHGQRDVLRAARGSQQLAEALLDGPEPDLGGRGLVVPIHKVALKVCGKVFGIPHRVLLHHLFEVVSHLRGLSQRRQWHPSASFRLSDWPQHLLQVLVLERGRELQRHEIQDPAQLLVQQGHNTKLTWGQEGQVVSSATCSLEAEGALILGAFFGHEVHVLGPLALLRFCQDDLGLRVRAHPEGEVEAAGEARRDAALVVTGLGAQGADAAHVVDLGHPPQRELRGLEELLELRLDILATHHGGFLAVVTQKLLWVPHGLQHEFLRHGHFWRHLGFCRSHASLLSVHGATLQVVLLPLGRIAQH
mmetsp:Transcript_52600/g.170965  ORF Transcript_52600/g.170965 Transcript_52600/m.170965 type:complete len:389 (+) Transcript_52600:1451-2617(+)